MFQSEKEFGSHSESADLKRIEHEKAKQQNTPVDCCRFFNYLDYSELQFFSLVLLH